MLFECEHPFAGEEGCVTGQKRLRGRIGDPGPRRSNWITRSTGLIILQ